MREESARAPERRESPKERGHRDGEVAKGVPLPRAHQVMLGDWKVQHDPSSHNVEGAPSAPSLSFKPVSPGDGRKESHLVQTLIRLFLD